LDGNNVHVVAIRIRRHLVIRRRNKRQRAAAGDHKPRLIRAADYRECDRLQRQLHQEALDVAAHEADLQIALSDGAVCLEKFLTTYFPRAVLILDFWHAAEHLAELARRTKLSYGS